MLSGMEIKRRVENKEGIYISDFNESRLNPNSYNLRLHKDLQVYDSKILDMKKKSSTTDIVIPDEGLLLKPNKLYLGRTVESTTTEGLVPILSGRSSIGRLGIFVHITAGFGDNGFSAKFWTLEIAVVQPVIIYPNVEICQIAYHPIEGDQSIKYNGKYQHKEIMASELYKDFND